jgi:hypothetical protein
MDVKFTSMKLSRGDAIQNGGGDGIQGEWWDGNNLDRSVGRYRV